MGKLWCNRGLFAGQGQLWAARHQRIFPKQSIPSSVRGGRLSAGEPAQTTTLKGQEMKRTYQGSKVRRARTHGFLVRMKSRGGRAVIAARRAKGRKRLAV